MILCTHSGSFQADDVLATAILLKLYPEAKIVRSRQPEDWQKADIVFDVGERLDNEKFFDHHQRGGAGCRDNGVPYAAVGLIWRKFGLQYCQHFSDADISAELLWAYVDAHLIEGVDANDCGKVEGHFVVSDSVQTVQVQSFSSVIDTFNPLPLVDDQSNEAYLAAFLQAVAFAKVALERVTLEGYSTKKAEAILRQADTGGQILELPVLCKWTEYVVAEMPHVLLIIIPGYNGEYLLRTVPLNHHSFEARYDLPLSWAGLSGAAFQQHTGVADAIFCHNGRFIAGAGSLEGIKALATIAIEAQT